MESVLHLLPKDRQKILVTYLSAFDLAIRLSCFYNNEGIVRKIIKIAKSDGYDNKNDLVITYDKDTNMFMMVTSNEDYYIPKDNISYLKNITNDEAFMQAINSNNIIIRLLVKCIKLIIKTELKRKNKK